MKGKKLAIWFAIMAVCGVIGLISRLITREYDVWAIVGIVSSAVMVVCGIVGLIVSLKSKEGK